MSPWGQSSYDVRFAWGCVGARNLVEAGCHSVVVVDVLSFSTTATLAAGRGMAIKPVGWDSHSEREVASAVGAAVAVGRSVAQPGEISLSPQSVLDAKPVERLLLRSPNGATITQQVAGSGGGSVRVAVGCIRNRTAVARWLLHASPPFAIIASGERWPDGSLRPALEDLLGAGLIIEALVGVRRSLRASPEAEAARLAASSDVASDLVACASGIELAEMGFSNDVELASLVDADETVAALCSDGWLRKS